MHELEAKLKPICNIEEKLVRMTEKVADTGLEQVDTHELGEVVDMIKDLSEVKKNCYKAEYYKSIVKAMKEAEEDEKRMGPYMARMGYDHWRYPTSGRFASKGHGMRMGYVMPELAADAYGDMVDTWTENMRMGYTGGGVPSSGTNTGSSSGQSGRSGYGRPYEMYKSSRRHYTETRSPEDKKEMNDHAIEHVAEAVDTIVEIMEEADPVLKTQLKKHVSRVVSEMND